VGFNILPRIKLSGDTESASWYAREGIRQLEILKNLMSFQNLKQDVRIVRYTDGTEITCRSVFGIDEVEIYTPSYKVELKPKVILATSYYNGLIFRSEDCGISWIGVDPTTVCSSGSSGLAYLADDNVLGSMRGSGICCVVKSINYGQTWNDLSQTNLNIVSSNQPLSFLENLGGGVILLAGGVAPATTFDKVMFRSVDSGETWTDYGQFFDGYGDFNPVGSKVYAPKNLGGGIAVVGTSARYQNIKRTVNYGVTWSDINLGAVDGIPLVEGQTGAAFAIRGFADLGGGVVLACSGEYDWFDNVLGMQHRTYVFKSEDYGATWTILSTWSDFEDLIGISYFGNGIVLLGSQYYGTYRSVDSGSTWSLVSNFNSYCFYYGQGIALAGTLDGHILRSADAGLTWIDLGEFADWICKFEQLGSE